MAITLETSTYSAFRGYAWSNVPAGTDHEQLDRFYRQIADARGDFPDPTCVDLGFVSDGKIAAVFTIQNVDKWDAEKRSSDYAAFAFFPTRDAWQIDIVELLNNDFFWTPTHEPPASITYEGPGATSICPIVPTNLERKHEYPLRDPRSLGSLLAKYGGCSDRWVGLMKAENILKIECNHWK